MTQPKLSHHIINISSKNDGFIVILIMATLSFRFQGLISMERRQQSLSHQYYKGMTYNCPSTLSSCLYPLSASDWRFGWEHSQIASKYLCRWYHRYTSRWSEPVDWFFLRPSANSLLKAKIACSFYYINQVTPSPSQSKPWITVTLSMCILVFSFNPRPRV